MDTKELIKKYWFLGVIAIALIGFVIFYSVDAYKNRDIVVDTKVVDGKYVVYTLDDEDVYADDFYDTLYDSYGINIAFLSYERAVLNKAIKTTEDMRTSASNYAANVLSRYSQSEIESSLKASGYTKGVDDLQEYYINLQKRDIAIKDYINANSDKYLTDSIGTNGRLIYHILVKTDTEEILDEEGNVTGYNALPTEEQTTKLNEILDALADENNEFEYVAYMYSEDSSSQYGGYIGMINEENKEMYDMVFANTALSMKDGEVSEVITSQFGYHILYDAGSTADALLEDYYFLQNLESQYPELIISSILDKGTGLGFEIVDEDVKEKILAQIESEAE